MVRETIAAMIGMTALIPGALAWSQQPDPDPLAEVEPAPDAAARNAAEPEFDRSPEAIAAARKRFDAMVSAYRGAPAVRDETTVRVVATYMGEEAEQTMDVPVLVSPDAARIELAGTVFTAVDGTLYAEWNEQPERYVAIDFTGPVRTELFIEHSGLFPFPHYPVMYAEDPLASIFFFTLEPQIAGRRTIEFEGSTLEEILIEPANEGAPVKLAIDPESNLMRRFEAWLHDPGMAEQDGTAVIVEMNPTRLDEAPLEEFLVRTDGRKAVASLAELYAGPTVSDLVGEPAPVFELEDLDGNPARLESMLGRVVVLDFWTVPAEGLHPTLDTLRRLSEWATEQEINASFLTVNLGDPEEEIRALWNAEKFPFRVALDPALEAAQAYRLTVPPVIVVIAPDGTIHSTHVGSQAEAVIGLEGLQEAVRAAHDKGL